MNQDIAELKGLVHETGRTESLLAAMGEELADPSRDFEHDMARPSRPAAGFFDFVEVRCGGPWLTSSIAGFASVRPVLDYRTSPFFSLADSRCLE